MQTKKIEIYKLPDGENYLVKADDLDQLLKAANDLCQQWSWGYRAGKREVIKDCFTRTENLRRLYLDWSNGYKKLKASDHDGSENNQ